MGSRPKWKLERNSLGLMLELGLLLLGFCVVIYQDFSQRLISLWTIPFIFFVALYIATKNEAWEVSFLIFNLGFLFIQLAGVSLYFSVKHRRFINISKDYLGLGDILFFVAISPLFAPFQFCIFFIGSLIFILGAAFAYQFITKKELKTIPLAGAMSGCIGGYLLLLNHYNYSPYNDWFLLEFIYG
jgi:hypothetical protein